MKLVVAEVEKTGKSIKISLLWSDALNTVKTQFCFLKINENVFEHRRFEKRRVAKRKREGQFEKEASYNLPFAQKPRKTEFSFLIRNSDLPAHFPSHIVTDILIDVSERKQK